MSNTGFDLYSLPWVFIGLLLSFSIAKVVLTELRSYVANRREGLKEIVKFKQYGDTVSVETYNDIQEALIEANEIDNRLDEISGILKALDNWSECEAVYKLVAIESVGNNWDGGEINDGVKRGDCYVRPFYGLSDSTKKELLKVMEKELLQERADKRRRLQRLLNK